MFGRGCCRTSSSSRPLQSSAPSALELGKSFVFVGRGIDDTHGAIAGTIRDCGDPNRANPGPQRIVNATVGISFDGDSKLSYFNGNPNDTLPLPGRAATNSDGTYAAIDLPSGPNRVSPIICRPGTTCSSDADFVNAGTRNLFQTPKSIVITSFEPVR